MTEVGEARAGRRPPWGLCLVAAVLEALGWLAPVGAQASEADVDGRRRYQPPILAPVVDPFRPPPEPWLAGNRGLEYETIPGSRVGAIGPGQVIFAGPVAGDLHVTIRHPDGLRSSYSFLAAIHVRLGQRLAAGTTVGVTGEMFHLGVRSGDAYIDPAGLWGRWVRGGLVMLVPDRVIGRRGGSTPAPQEPGRPTRPGAEHDGRPTRPGAEHDGRGSPRPGEEHDGRGSPRPGEEHDGRGIPRPSTALPGGGGTVGLGAGRVLVGLAAPGPSWVGAERPDTLPRRPTTR